jgi:hypothetical protein
MRYAVVVMLDTDDDPKGLANEIMSGLEFEHRTTVRSVVVRTEDGEAVAVYDRQEGEK